MDTERIGELMGAFFVLVGVACAVALVIGLPTWLLWNWLMPELFGLPVITFWQAVGLNLLCFILFRSVDFKSKK